MEKVLKQIESGVWKIKRFRYEFRCKKSSCSFSWNNNNVTLLMTEPPPCPRCSSLSSISKIVSVDDFSWRSWRIDVYNIHRVRFLASRSKFPLNRSSRRKTLFYLELSCKSSNMLRCICSYGWSAYFEQFCTFY